MCILTACVGGRIGDREPPALPASFSADARVKTGDTEVVVRIERGEGRTEFTVLAPADAEGLRFEVSGEESRAYFDGMDGFIDLESLPSNAFARATAFALDVAASGALEPEKTKTSWDYKGECRAGAFLLKTDAASGAFTLLSIPSVDLSVEFTSFSPAQ